MNLKKLSLAAALSIGILTVNGIANAASCPAGVPCPAPQAMAPAQVTMCPTCHMNPCTCAQRVTMCPTCHANPCTCAVPCNPCDAAVSATLPNCAPNAKTLERQAFAFPSIGHSSVVIPKGNGLVQIGGSQEAIALGNACPSGLSAAPEFGNALTLYPKNMAGGAAPFGAVCPNQIMQGTDISRCNIPNATSILQSNYFNNMSTGAALPIGGCAPMVAPACGPCGAAAPFSPCEPVCSPCGAAAPLSLLGAPMGAAAQLGGCPIPIQTSSGLQFQKTDYIQVPCGAAAPCCPVGDQYPDVSSNTPDGCDINNETCQGVLAGYPDRYYKPCQPLKRSELAAAIVAGFDLKGVPAFSEQIFNDVSTCHWANAVIDKVYNRGIMTGNSCNRFRPEEAATNAETLSALAKLIPANVAPCDIQSVLAAYPDAGSVPEWAKSSVAKSLNMGVTKGLPNCASINPNGLTGRTEIATMIKSLREKLCMESVTVAPTGAAASYQPQIISGTIPTLKVQMQDIVTARTSLIGDVFVAKTIEPLTINGQCFPSGSEVRGRVVEVIRPGMGDNGGIRLGFNSIKSGKCIADLPKDILSATVIKEKNPNIISRVVAWPFSWTGKVAGIAGRTVGGAATIAGNTTEGFLNNIANGNSDLFNWYRCGASPFRAAGRSYVSALREVAVGVYDEGVNAFTGVAGVLKESGDEIAYVVSPDGARIAQVNPGERLSVAFGACNTTGAAAPCAVPCAPATQCGTCK